jgi:hypothetical protein
MEVLMPVPTRSLSGHEALPKDTLAYRLRKTKAALPAVVLTLAGIILIALAGWMASLSASESGSGCRRYR